MKKRYKSRYVLGVGYPWFYGINKAYSMEVGINMKLKGYGPIQLKNPIELLDRDVPKFRLILERVKPSKAGEEKRT